MTLRVACLGAGYFAQHHHAAWASMEGCTLVGVADQDHDRAQAAANTHGAQGFTDLATMIAATSPDIIDIITPPPSHHTAVTQALAARPRAVICQKPFATSLEEATALAEAAQTAGVPLIIHENFRFQPWFRTIKTAIDADQLGEVLNLTFRLRTGDGQGPNAYMDRQPYFQTMPRLLIHETGVHYLDTFRYLMGPAQSVYADLRRLNPAIAGEDAGHVVLGWQGGARAVLDGNRLLDFDTDSPRRTFGEALIEGTQASLHLTGDGAVHLRRFGTRGAQAECLLEGRDWPGFAGDCVRALQLHVRDALTTGTALENTAQDYLEVLRMEAACYASDAEGRKVTL
jgi:predicted dehydrogenase